MQTKKNADINAIVALKQGLDDLSAIRGFIKEQFENEMESHMMD